MLVRAQARTFRPPDHRSLIHLVSSPSRPLTGPWEQHELRSHGMAGLRVMKPRTCQGPATCNVGSTNRELIVGDAITLTSFSIYKQIASIVLSPSFEGWLSPLRFSPIRFIEWFAFAGTLVASWAAASFLVGTYNSSLDLPRTLQKTSLAWLGSMPVAAAQLVLSTAAENNALVGEPGWAATLPLAATGPGEPFATAAGVLGVMTIWRAYYCTHLDMWSAADESQWQKFREALFMVCVMGMLGTIIIAGLQLVLSPTNIEELNSSLHLPYPLL